MNDSGNGAGEQIAQWLKEAGRRAQRAAPAAADSDDTFNSPASLHAYLEQLAGRKLRTHEELLDYLREVAGTRPREHRLQERHRAARELALIGLLALSYLHYYYWDVQLQIAALNSVRVLIPVAPPLETKA